VSGSITDGPVEGQLTGPSHHWVETLAGFAELGFDTFVFWPDGDPLAQLERFSAEIVPQLRA
jgi:hypothetical protein